MNQLIRAIETLLAQTQCAECGYDGCHAYACAVATGAAKINRCVPGGEPVVHRLAQLTGQAALPPIGKAHYPAVVKVIEADCIGCTLCIQACPADAIIGAAKQMHTVVSAWCTGCRLCFAACPVDCIDMQPMEHVPDDWNVPTPGPATESWLAARAALARDRYEALLARRQATQTAQEKPDSDKCVSAKNRMLTPEGISQHPASDLKQGDAISGSAPSSKQDIIAAALERARLRRQAMKK